MRASLTTFGRRKGVIGAHFIRLVAFSSTLIVMLYSQRPTLAGSCSELLSHTAGDTWVVGQEPSGSIPRKEIAGFQYASPAYFWGSGKKEYTLTPGGFCAPARADRHEDSMKNRQFHFGTDRYGDSSFSTGNDGTLATPDLAGVSLWAQNKQSPPAPQPTQLSKGQGSPKHIFWLVPAFHVSYLKQFQPLTPRQKFDEWLQGTYDPRGLSLYGLESATLEHSSRDGFCGYGKGWGGYGRCLGSMELDANISSFFGDFLFPVIMHQDPRYFRRGEGSFAGRTWHAVSCVFLTHADSGRTVFFASALSGSVLAAAASNAYYPAQDRGFDHSINRMGIDLADTALFNVAAEFWPDVKHKIGRVF